MSARIMVHAGTFYPNNGDEIARHIRAFEAMEAPKPRRAARALIVPHAGYVYSGFTAHLAYEQLEDTAAHRAIVIGPSHRVPYEGMSVGLYDRYETPMGQITGDLPYAEKVMQTHRLGFAPTMHREHSTEVQMPFIRHYAPQLTVVEMVYGYFSAARLGKIITALLEDPDNLIVISTDLSHFHTETEANRLDDLCLHAIRERDPAQMHGGCEACGALGVEGMLIAARDKDLQVELLDYRTSGWVTKAKGSVVGYASAVLF